MNHDDLHSLSETFMPYFMAVLASATLLIALKMGACSRGPSNEDSIRLDEIRETRCAQHCEGKSGYRLYSGNNCVCGTGN